MALSIADRVKETTTTTGTGSISLAGAVTGYRAFSGVLNTGDTTYYCVADQGGSNWEVGLGTFTSPSTLARTTILSSSNSNSVVTFGSGTKDVFITEPSSQVMLAYNNNGPRAGLRNRIINGNMAVDQRNSGAAQTITTASAYTVDRWIVGPTGASVTGQRVAGSAPSQYRYQITGAASITGIAFSQRIEAANSFDLSGKTCTISVDMANSLLTGASWALYYPNSTDSFGGAITLISSGSWTVSSSISRYSAQVAVPSAATTGLLLIFFAGVQTSGTWTIGDVQVEEGPQATPFERRPIGLELALCQRYYFAESTFAISTGQYGTSSFKQIMRAIPTVVITPSSGPLSGLTVGYGSLYCQASTTTGITYTASAEL